MSTHQHWDVAVVGVGTMGSMALWRLAERGVRAVGIERFDIGHERGAAGGETRIFRTAYKEGREYVPLLQESRRLWADLEAASGADLLARTGALTIGSPQHPEVHEVLESGSAYGLGLEVLDLGETRRRFPQHRLLEGEIAVLDPDGGLLRPRAAIRAAVDQAVRRGADLITGTAVQAIRETGGAVEIDLGDSVVTADRAIVCLGPWTSALLPDVAGRFEVRRSVLHWFEVDAPASFAPERFPVGLRRSGREGDLSFFPCIDGRTIKVNFHVPKEVVVEPDDFDGEISPEYSRRVAAGVVPLFDGVRARPVRAAGYMEGYSPDNHGLVGPVPGLSRVTALAAFSGHGFKLSPVIGDIAADLALDGGTERSITHMEITRPGPFGTGRRTQDPMTSRSTRA